MKDQNKAVDLPRALEWVRTTGVDTKEPKNKKVHLLGLRVRSQS